MNLSSRQVFSVEFLGCASLLAYGYYLQYVEGLNPCNLCIFERVAFFCVSVICLLGFIHSSKGLAARIYHGLVGIVSLTGAAIAARHIWIQHLPADQVPECGPGLDYLMIAFPLQEVIQTVLKGSGDCAKVNWQFIGLSIPEWSLICFTGLVLISLAGVFKAFQQRNRQA